MSDETREAALEIGVAATEAATVAELAAQPVQLDDDGHLTAALPPGWVLDRRSLEAQEERPRRSKGTVHVHDAASFVKAMNRRRNQQDNEPVVYADDATNALVGVLNDDAGESPGWRDYRVSLRLIPTPEWSHWCHADGKLLAQDDFASHIEDGLNELQEPEPATMLEIAQTFHATTTAKFKTGRRLASGEQQFQYEEDIEATAGTIEIPQRITLVLAPFYGSARYEVGAWFRYRLTRDVFSLGYKLDRPHEVERAAFADIRTQVETELDDLFISGPAPA